jgi:homoserine acetyltransferase
VTSVAEAAAAVERDVGIGALELASGETIPDVVQRVTRYGCEPLPDGSNVVFVPHALSGSSRVLEWWDGIAGAGGLFDTARWCVVGINVLGGCYGSTGPSSLAPDGRRWGPRFPVVTIADIVEAERRALLELGIERFAAVISGSLGGQQALQWAHAQPDRVGQAIVVGAALREPGRSRRRRSVALTRRALRRRGVSRAPRRRLRAPVRRQQLHHADAGDGSVRLARARAAGRADAADLRRDRRRSALLTAVRVELCGALGRGRLGFRVPESDHGHDGFLAHPQTLAAVLRDGLETALPPDASTGS